MRKSREREGPAFGKEAIVLSPSQALAIAESFLAGQGYVVMHRTYITMMAVHECPEGPTGRERIPKVVVLAVPEPDGGVTIKVGGDDREGAQGRQGLWKLWAETCRKVASRTRWHYGNADSLFDSLWPSIAMVWLGKQGAETA